MEFNKKLFVLMLKSLCFECGSMSKLSKKSGVSVAYISKLIDLQYKNPPSPEILRKLANSSHNPSSIYLSLLHICGYLTDKEYNVLALKI